MSKNSLLMGNSKMEQRFHEVIKKLRELTLIKTQEKNEYIFKVSNTHVEIINKGNQWNGILLAQIAKVTESLTLNYFVDKDSFNIIIH